MFLLVRPPFWLPLAIVLLLCGPWYLLTDPALVDACEQEPGFRHSATAAAYFPGHAFRAFGLTLSPPLVLGLIGRLLIPARHNAVRGRWAAIVALALSVWIFHTVVSAGYEERDLLPITPALAMFWSPVCSSSCACSSISLSNRR